VTEVEKFLQERGCDISKMRGYGSLDDWSLSSFVRSREIRDDHIRRFGFAVLTDDAITSIAPYQPLLEVGCGSGYWSYELRQAGFDVIATDPGTGRYRFSAENGGHWGKLWVSDIERISGVDAVNKYPARNLLTVWPDYDDPWAFETLQAFKGGVVLYGGENRGCTADDAFHDFLEKHFTLMETIGLPQFDGIHDDLQVWRRTA
jgi:hypothetical protein